MFVVHIEGCEDRLFFGAYPVIGQTFSAKEQAGCVDVAGDADVAMKVRLSPLTR